MTLLSRRRGSFSGMLFAATNDASRLTFRHSALRVQPPHKPCVPSGSLFPLFRHIRTLVPNLNFHGTDGIPSSRNACYFQSTLERFRIPDSINPLGLPVSIFANSMQAAVTNAVDGRSVGPFFGAQPRFDIFLGRVEQLSSEERAPKAQSHACRRCVVGRGI